jgi:hypothetical protein
LLALLREFAKPRPIADRRAFAFEIERGAVIDQRAKRKPAADKSPSGMDILPAAMKRLRCFKGQFDRQRTDQRARREAEDAGQPLLREIGIETERRPD